MLRLECSIDCISGPVGHQQNIFRSFSHCQRFCWVSGSPPMLYKLVIGPIPIVHTNLRHFQTFYNYLINFNWVSGSPTTYFPFILSLSAFLMKKQKFKKNELNKFNWVSGSPPILSQLMSYSWCAQQGTFQYNAIL